MKFLKTTAALAALVILSACATTGFRQAVSALPIDVVNSNSGHLMAYRAYETTDRLYVSGTAMQHPLAQRTHIDVQLLGPSGNIIAERQDDIAPVHAAAGGGPRSQDTFVASFPLADARASSRIRISVHTGPHRHS